MKDRTCVRKGLGSAAAEAAWGPRQGLDWEAQAWTALWLLYLVLLGLPEEPPPPAM